MRVPRQRVRGLLEESGETRSITPYVLEDGTLPYL